jgi:hypothetical protein
MNKQSTFENRQNPIREIEGIQHNCLGWSFSHAASDELFKESPSENLLDGALKLQYFSPRGKGILAAPGTPVSELQPVEIASGDIH